MAKRRSPRLLVLFVAFALSLTVPASAGAVPGWSIEKLPGGGVFGGAPFGEPGDLQCWSVNRCLLMANGNQAYSNGLFVFTGDPDQGGSPWRQLSTRCGATNAANGRVIWAGPSEFWTITKPSFIAAIEPQDNRNGLALCHFNNGEIVGSYSTRRAGTSDVPSRDPYQTMFSGACKAPDNCWFGGIASARPTGYSSGENDPPNGSFHLHWNGASLTTVFAPSLRAVSDIVADHKVGGGFAESVFAGSGPGAALGSSFGTPPEYSPEQVVAPEASNAAGFDDGTLKPAPVANPDSPGGPPLPDDATEVLALDDGLPGSGGGLLWAVGGGATAGPSRDATPNPNLPEGADDAPVDRGPFAAYRSSDGKWHELTMPAGLYTPNTRFVDVAAIPGTDQALVAVLPDNSGQFIGSPSTIARIDASEATVNPSGGIVNEPASAFIGEAQSQGSVQKIECVTAINCWAATTEGRLLRFSEPFQPVPPDTDPGASAFSTIITYRPNEAIEQATSDAPPPDDSLLFAPPPDAEPVEQVSTVGRLKAAVRSVKSKLHGRTLTLTFRVVRAARVTVTARRKRRVVAQVKTRLLKPGNHSVELKLNPKRWPTKLSMKVTEPPQPNVVDPNTAPIVSRFHPSAITSSVTRCEMPAPLEGTQCAP
jgi:hypothetical protein